jgi:hypothetical protein
MKLHADLTLRLLEIPDVQSAQLGSSKLFICGDKEIARLREDGFVDIKLTHPLIAALGMKDDETTNGWVQMNVNQGADFPAVVALVQRAAHATKLRLRSTDEIAS